MRPPLRSFTLATSMLLLLNPPTTLAEPLPAFNFAKRDNTVYVTVTEYRYVAERPAPSNVPPAAPVALIAPPARVAPLLVAFVPPAPQPNSNPNVMTNMARPAPIVPAALVPPPATVIQPANTILPPAPAAAWTPPTNDALTYTSYAGLLSTMAPAFYPTPLSSAAVPSRAISFFMPQQQPPPPPAPVTHAPTLHTAPIPFMAPTVETTPNPNTPILSSPESAAPIPTLSASSAVPMEKEKESAAAHTALSATAAHSSDSTSSSSIDSASVSKEGTTSLSSTTTSTTTSHDVTISTTTTTHGDTTSTRTTVGTDGTTTVLTEYPTSTRRTTTSTSGVEAKWPRMQGGRQDPSVGSVVGYLAGLLISEARWSMTATAMIVAMALPGAVALLV